MSEIPTATASGHFTWNQTGVESRQMNSDSRNQVRK